LGEGRTLTAVQENELRKLITDKMPDQLKLPFALWTRRAVAELIEQRFGLKLPVRTMGEYLKRWGFTPQKPLRKAYEQQPKAVQEWLTTSYPVIAAAAKAEGAEIFWGDQTGVNNQANAPRSYAPRGQTPTVRQQAKRFGFSVMSAVTNRGSARWMVYEGALDSARLIEFLVRLVRLAGGRKVYLILDNLRVHHSKAGQAMARPPPRTDRVHHCQLQPDLNTDERLNARSRASWRSCPPRAMSPTARADHRPVAFLPPPARADPVLLQSPTLPTPPDALFIGINSKVFGLLGDQMPMRGEGRTSGLPSMALDETQQAEVSRIQQL
jgi:hypothetical protein